MDMQKFIDKLCVAVQQSGVEAFQIEYDYAERKMLELFDGKIEKQSDTENQTLLLAVMKNGKIGYCSCGNLDEAVIPEVVKAAKENALLIGETEENFFYDGKGEYSAAEAYHPLSGRMAALNPVAFMQEIEKKAYAADKRITQVQKVVFSKGKTRRIMRNSLGLDLSREDESASCSVMVTAEDGNSKEWGLKGVAFDKGEDFDAAFIAGKAVENALSRLNGMKPESGMTKVVFENKCFCDILAFVEGIASALNVQKQKSQFAGKIGQLAAAPIVTITDDPLLKGGYATTPFDGEGVPTRKKDIIAGGVLQTYLHSLKTAHKDGVVPTGNGAGRNGIVEAMNLYLQPGDVSKQELLERVKDGIYIDRLNGLHAGFHMVSGDFSFGARGYLIENGKIGRPLVQFTVAGNYYRLLKDIKMIADDLEFKTSGFGSPTVWVDGLTIGGK
mgnify:CR=1 FL=1